jgi:hypothetical protein
LTKKVTILIAGLSAISVLKYFFKFITFNEYSFHKSDFRWKKSQRCRLLWKPKACVQTMASRRFEHTIRASLKMACLVVGK